MKDNKIELYIWPEIVPTREIILSRDLELKVDEKASIGAGASGLLPEVNLLLIVTASLIANGFFGAIGEDLWKIIKKGVKKLAANKPPIDDPSLPPDYNGEFHYELIWWFHFNDKRILVIIGLSSEQEVRIALEFLPEAINDAVRSNTEFSRIVWNGSSWEIF